MRFYCYYKLISPSINRHFKPNPFTYNSSLQFHSLLSNSRNPTKTHIPKLSTLNPKSCNFNTFAPAATSDVSATKTHIPKLSTLNPKSCNFNTSAPAATSDVSAIVNEISGLTLLEVSDLTEVLRTKMGIEEMPVMAMMMPGMGFSGGIGMKGKGAGTEAKVEEKAEKTAFDLNLEGGYDAAAKIKIIKEVRAFTSLGLKEAKDLVEKAPTLLKKGVTKEEAEKIVEKMKEVGAKVTMV